MTTEDGGVEPDWQRTALEYAKRIHVLERIAVADQESYRKLQAENENLKLTLAAVRDAFDELPTHWTDEDGRMRGVVRWDDVLAVYVRVKQAVSEALR